MYPKFNPKTKFNLLTANNSLLSILAIPLMLGVNSFFPLNQNPSITHPTPAQIPEQISQANEPERDPDAIVLPVNGTVNVKFTNTTNAGIFYQVVGQTSRRILAGQSTVTLEKLKLPASILFRRQDAGFLKVTLNPVSEGNLEVKLEETKDLGLDRDSLTIRNDGSVFLR
ncbi:hypothetical protein BCD67_08850 [Oscillatoriales cyanobacterium USR001]|nr:hypothetical protein BCD67_08850 [Oscillatoriales cyanobacterium USR001]